MKTEIMIRKGIALLSACLLLLSVSTARADVMGSVEDFSIAGGVQSYAISKNGKYIYAASLENLYVQTRNETTGKLTAIQTVPLPASHFGHDGMVVSPDGAHVYIRIDSDILRYDVDNNGNLAYKKKITLPGSGDNRLVISENGQFIYAGAQDEIHILKRFSNGDLQKIGTAGAGLGIDEITTLRFGPNDETLYVANAYSDNVYIFSVNKTNGGLSNIQNIPAGGFGITMSKDGKFFYALKRGKEAIYIYNRATNGKLTPNKVISKIPAPADTPSHSILFGVDNDIIVSPNQKYIYIYGDIKSNISVWGRDTTTGDLTYLDRVDNVDGGIDRLKTSPEGKYLYLGAGNGFRVFDLSNDLALVKTGPSTDVAPKGMISYTLAVTNHGPSDAYNVVITDTLPAGTTFISGTHNNINNKKCSANGQNVSCDMGNFKNGENYNAIIQVKAPATEGVITNTATVSSDQLDTKTANNTDTAKSTIKKGGSSLPPVKGGGTSSGGGSLPMSILGLLLLPALIRRRFS